MLDSSFPQTSLANQVKSLTPLSIGNIKIGFPVVQAALSGYSDLPMRVIAHRHGASYGLCEVMLDQFLLALSRLQLHLETLSELRNGPLFYSLKRLFVVDRHLLLARSRTFSNHACSCIMI